MSDRDLAAKRLLAVTEEELQRIVLDIHDGPVQNLFAALSQLTVQGMSLKWCKQVQMCWLRGARYSAGRNQSPKMCPLYK
jgi:hypothetical protein